MKKLTKWILAFVLIAFSLVSFFKIAAIEPKDNVFSDTQQLLEDKEGKILKLTAASVVASVAVAAIPGDATTPIADQVADVSSKLLIVFCALILEKYLLSATWVLCFRYVLPAACVVMILFLITNRESLRKFAFRLAVFALAVMLTIPASMGIGASIEKSHDKDYQAAVDALNEWTDQKEVDKATRKAEAESEKEAEEGSFLEKASACLHNLRISIEQLVQNVQDTAEVSYEKIENFLANVLESIAVFIVTCCVIPILILAMFLWLAKSLLQIDFLTPTQAFVKKTYRSRKKMRGDDDDENEPDIPRLEKGE